MEVLPRVFAYVSQHGQPAGPPFGRYPEWGETDCTVEAGLYLTAGTRVALPDGQVVKALTLSGQPGLLFRRNSQTGAVEALPRSGTWTGLNAALHSNT